MRLFGLYFHAIFLNKTLVNTRALSTMILPCFYTVFLTFFASLSQAGGGGEGAGSSSSSSDSSSDSSSEDEQVICKPKRRAETETHLSAAEEIIEIFIDTVMEELLFTHDLYSLIHWYEIQEYPVDTDKGVRLQQYFKQHAIKEKYRTNQFDKTSVQVNYAKLKVKDKKPGFQLYRLLRDDIEKHRERDQHAGHRFILYVLNRKIMETYPEIWQSSKQFKSSDQHRFLEVSVFKSNAKDSPKNVMKDVEKYINELPDSQSVLDFYQVLKEAYTSEEDNLTSLSRSLVLSHSTCPFSDNDIVWIKKRRDRDRAKRLYSVAVKNGPHGMIFHLEQLQCEGIFFNSPENVVSALERSELIQAQPLAMLMGINMRISSYTRRIAEYKKLMREMKAPGTRQNKVKVESKPSNPQPPVQSLPPVNPAFQRGAEAIVPQLGGMTVSEEITELPSTTHTSAGGVTGPTTSVSFQFYNSRLAHTFQSHPTVVNEHEQFMEPPPPTYWEAVNRPELQPLRKSE